MRTQANEDSHAWWEQAPSPPPSPSLQLALGTSSRDLGYGQGTCSGQKNQVQVRSVRRSVRSPWETLYFSAPLLFERDGLAPGEPAEPRRMGDRWIGQLADVDVLMHDCSLVPLRPFLTQHAVGSS